MLENQYSLCYAELEDMDSWMKMIEGVKYNFPGLETTEGMNNYKDAVIKNIKRRTAICVKHYNEVVGVMIFSYNAKMLCCMAIHPNHRRRGIGSAMIEKLIALFPANVDISVTTFRENDVKGNAPRALYKKFGFKEDELLIEFGYPHQRFILCRNL